ncbi:MAG TPA: 16S rRNA (guanine(527)-N(7))-methyltransferase RsmG [Chloroflexota bacterium]|nr:16S rRNA (guanine(527)-N(7))-methyltransferase RsmG [Chloroflexota bacterium]
MSSNSCAEAYPALSRGAELLGINLDDGQRDAFVRYCQLLLETNVHTNLTAIRDPAGVMSSLFLDALSLTAALPDGFRGSIRCVDVGAGAGLPGLPLKIVFPDWSLTLVDSVGKKTKFLESVVRELGLSGVTVVNARAEEVGRRPAYRDRADLCVARALAAMPTLLELCAPLVRPGGLLLFPKTVGVDREVELAGEAARRLHVRLSSVDEVPGDLGLGEDRVVVVYEKTGPTPSGYPRRVGLAKSRPIGF